MLVALLVHAVATGAWVSPLELLRNAGRFAEFFAEAIPGDLSRIGPILYALLVTFEMALVGTLGGVVLSVPLGVAAARNTTPHPVLYGLARGTVALFRTVPDIVWGIIFVITVGLGPPAGVLAITVDVAGFCGRFFAESIEEVDQGLLDALRAIGARPGAVVAGAVLPSCLPAFVATSLFALESSTRSAVVLGVVGAGGIGIELTTAMQLLRFDQALTIILVVFAAVLGVERLSAAIRGRLL